MANTTGWHYTLLPGNMQVIVSAHWHVHSIIALNLHAYPANRSLYTPENGFQATIKCQGGPFQALLKRFCSYCLRKLPEHGYYTTDYVYTTMCMVTSTILLCSIKSCLPSLYLYVIRVFWKWKWRKLSGAWEQGYHSACATTGVSSYHGYRQTEETVGKSSLFWCQRLTMWKPQKNLVKIILNHSQQISACSFVIISALTILYFLDQT